MIDFHEMEARMAVLEGTDMAHSTMVEPIVMQLANYYADAEPVLFTPTEMMRLAAIIRAQATMIDHYRDNREPQDDPYLKRRLLVFCGLTSIVASAAIQLVLRLV